MLPLIRPSWAAPDCIRAAVTTRLGGISAPPYDALNLGYSTQDDRAAVAENERLVAAALSVGLTDIRWVYQVHGNAVHDAEALPANTTPGATSVQGDAIVSHTPRLVCGIKVADCMPVLFCTRDGSAVGAAHAGWRGLAGGILERTVSALHVPPREISAWLGPCIGPAAFEVGPEVRAAFIAHDAQAGIHFRGSANEGKFMCDLYALARQRLRAVGIEAVTGGEYCTYSQPHTFFSHRRDRITGRMAAFIWIDQR